MIFKRMMQLVLLFISTTSLGQTLVAPTINLGGVDVNHVTESGTVSRSFLSLAILERTEAQWLVECQFRISGPSAKTDVAFDWYSVFIGNDASNTPYSNDGIEQPYGSISFIYDPNYGEQFTVRNYDATNDIHISNCIAKWQKGL